MYSKFFKLSCEIKSESPKDEELQFTETLVVCRVCYRRLCLLLVAVSSALLCEEREDKESNWFHELLYRVLNGKTFRRRVIMRVRLSLPSNMKVSTCSRISRNEIGWERFQWNSQFNDWRKKRSVLLTLPLSSLVSNRMFRKSLYFFCSTLPSVVFLWLNTLWTKTILIQVEFTFIISLSVSNHFLCETVKNFQCLLESSSCKQQSEE